MTDHHENYRLDPHPIGLGGQAEVMRAIHRTTGSVVALKRRTGVGEAARDRMRREIQVQSAIKHPNVMPVLDFDGEDYSWFTMPLAETTLLDLPVPLDTEALREVLRDGASGLMAAHATEHVHRDIKPSNILLLNDVGGKRWVVSDWGLVRRPQGATTANHTRTGEMIGTEGFAPPEAYSDAHGSDLAWDVYSLGRVAGWASSGTLPTPLRDLAAPEPWRRFVRLLTDIEPGRRPQDMARVLELLSLVATASPVLPGVSNDALAKAKEGDPDATLLVLLAAGEFVDDGAFFIDDLAELSGPGLDALVSRDPITAGRLLRLMDHHLDHVEWGRRDFDHYNVPLRWIQRVAEAAAVAGELELLEDACEALFRQEPRLDRWRQKERSRNWIASLAGEPAARVAVVLREHPEAARFYGEMRHASDSNIRAALREAVGRTPGHPPAGAGRP